MVTINQHYAYGPNMGWDDEMFGYEPEPMDWSEDGLYAWLDEMADLDEQEQARWDAI